MASRRSNRPELHPLIQLWADRVNINFGWGSWRSSTYQKVHSSFRLSIPYNSNPSRPPIFNPPFLHPIVPTTATMSSPLDNFKTRPLMSSSYINGIYIPSTLLVLGTLIVKSEWVGYAIALSLLLSGWKIFNNGELHNTIPPLFALPITPPLPTSSTNRLTQILSLFIQSRRRSSPPKPATHSP